MSIEALFWAWEIDGLAPSEKLTLLALANCHNGERNMCHPSLPYLERKTGLSRNSLRRTTEALEAHGLLTREHVEDDSGRNLGIRYHLKMKHGSEGATMAPRGTKSAQGGGHHGPPGGATMAPKLGKEHTPASSLRSEAGGGRATTRPQDFVLTDKLIAFCREKGLTDDQARETFDDFVDWTSSKGSRYIDWDATFRSHVRRRISDGAFRHARKAPLGAGRPGRSSGFAAYQRLHALYAEDERADGGPETPLPF